MKPSFLRPSREVGRPRQSPLRTSPTSIRLRRQTTELTAFGVNVLLAKQKQLGAPCDRHPKRPASTNLRPSQQPRAALSGLLLQVGERTKRKPWVRDSLGDKPGVLQALSPLDS